MNLRTFLSAGACLFIIGLGNSRAADTNDIKFTPVGEGAVNIGQIGSGYYKYPGTTIWPISHVWQQWAYSDLGYDVLIKKNLEINIKGEGLVAYSTPQIVDEPQTMQTRYFFYIKTANAAYSLLNSEQYGLQLQLGYFPFKYNPDARNLGENLFRTNAYPLLVYSNFDYPKADILGLRVHFQYESPEKVFGIQNDAMLHSELYSVPIQDWSVSDVFSAKFLDAITVGGGISFCNLLSVYQGKYGLQWVDQYLNPDTSSNNPNLANVKNYYLLGNAAGDTALFDWKSTKVMGRLSFDPKKFLHSDLFGKNDLMLYGEADIIGLKNYPIYFTDMKDRTFYSVGFNIPGFKIFDVINAELEYCSDTSAYSDEKLYPAAPNLQPVNLNERSSLLYKVKRDPVRWSVYVKKSILDGRVNFVAQCARDHKKINFYYFDIQHMSLMESMPTTQNWWWVFKTQFNF